MPCHLLPIERPSSSAKIVINRMHLDVGHDCQHVLWQAGYPFRSKVITKQEDLDEKVTKWHVYVADIRVHLPPFAKPISTMSAEIALNDRCCVWAFYRSRTEVQDLFQRVGEIVEGKQSPSFTSVELKDVDAGHLMSRRSRSRGVYL